MSRKLKWADVDMLVDILASQIADDGFKPDYLVAIARGGLVPATMLSHRLDVRRILVVQAEGYDDQARRHQVRLRSVPASVPSGVGLVVDELLETGDTMKAVTAHLGNCRTAVLINKHLGLRATYQAEAADPKTWVDFPWEATRR